MAVLKPIEKENVVECCSSDSDAMPQSKQRETRSMSQHSIKKTDCTNTNQPGDVRGQGSIVIKRQRNTVCNLPLSVHSSDSSLPPVTDIAATGKGKNVTRKCNMNERLTADSVLPHMGRGKNFEVDVLLTPLSERHVSYMRPNRSPLHGSLLPALVDSTPESCRSRPGVAKIIGHCKSVVPCLRGTRGLLRGGIEADAPEHAVPQSLEVSCSLVPLQSLVRNNGDLVNDDTEIDVFIRSFWDDEPSDNLAAGSGSPSVDCAVGKGLEKKFKAAAPKKGVGKQGVAVVTKSLRSKQQALKKVASDSRKKKLKRFKSKAETNCGKASSKNEKGSKAAHGVSVRYCAMTLRPRQKASACAVGHMVSVSWKLRLRNPQSTVVNTHREESTHPGKSACTRRKQPSRNVRTKVKPVAATEKAAGTRARSYSKTASPVMSSGCWKQLRSRTCGKRENVDKQMQPFHSKSVGDGAGSSKKGKKTRFVLICFDVVLHMHLYS